MHKFFVSPGAGKDVRLRKVLLITAGVLFLSIAGDARVVADEIPFIEVDPDSLTAFRIRGTEKPFVAVGINYFDHRTGWAPKLWQKFDETRVREQLSLAGKQGFNTIRMFLTYESFHRRPGKVCREGEQKLRKLLDICRRLGIYLIPSGPDHWEGMPAWRDRDHYANEAMLKADEAWWQNFTARFRNEPVILAWDLKNEPKIPWDTPAILAKWNAWLKREYGSVEKIARAWKLEPQKVGAMGEIKPPQPVAALNDPRLYDFQRFREHVGDEWTRRMTAAIRRGDPNHMITVGHVQYAVPLGPCVPKYYVGFNIKSNARYLDFVTIHFYPLEKPRPYEGPEGLDHNALFFETLLYLSSVGKPLMLGEFGWYGGGDIRRNDKPIMPAMPIEHQADWCKQILAISRGRLCGWLNWAFADTPESRDLTRFSGCWDENLKLKPWGEIYGQFARTVTKKPEPYRPFPEYLQNFKFDRKAMITSPATSREYLETFQQSAKSKK